MKEKKDKGQGGGSGESGSQAGSKSRGLCPYSCQNFQHISVRQLDQRLDFKALDIASMSGIHEYVHK